MLFNKMEDTRPSRGENLMCNETQVDYLIHILLEQTHIHGIESRKYFMSKAYITMEKNG